MQVAAAGLLLLIAVAVGCAALAYAATGLLKPLYARYALARPNARSSHKAPTPQGGGIGILAAMLAGLLVFAWLPAGQALRSPGYLALAVAACLMSVVGALDDIVSLSIRPRLAAQFAAAGLGLWAALPLVPAGLSVWGMTLMLPVLLIGHVWFINLSNFMDGIDGISVAQFVPVAGTIAALSVLGVVPTADAAIAAALAGALLGFAPYNRHVARLFMGDAGSLAIGLIAGWLLLRLALAGQPAAALILPLYYLADATLTLGRRLLRGENVTQAHRTHFYQLATDLGWSVPAVTARIWWANAGLALAGIASVWFSGTPLKCLALAAAAAIVARLLTALSRAPAQ